MTERTIYNELATLAREALPGWQIPMYEDAWPKEAKRLCMEIVLNEPITPGFSGRRVELLASFTGAAAPASSAAIDAFCAAVSAASGLFTCMRLDRTNSESVVGKETAEYTDTERITFYLEPNEQNQTQPE